MPVLPPIVSHALVAALVLVTVSQTPATAPNQSQPTVTLPETLEWIRSRIADENTDTPGVRVRTTFEADGCRVSLRKDGGALTLLTGAFHLKDIAYLDVVDRPVGTLWTGTFLVFKTADGGAGIRRGDLLGSGGRLTQRDTSSFEWHLGSVRVGGSSKELRDLGDRLVNAFANAVQLCGGTVRKSPF